MLTTLAALFPAEVRAGCNHPWVKRADLPSSLNDLIVLAPVGPATASDAGFPEELPHRSPCMGGACSRLPELPMTAPTSAPDRIDLWGDLPGSLRPEAPGSATRCPVPDRPRPTRMARPIERPPRLTSTH
jgi:hypothetical protein